MTTKRLTCEHTDREQSKRLDSREADGCYHPKYVCQECYDYACNGAIEQAIRRDLNQWNCGPDARMSGSSLSVRGTDGLYHAVESDPNERTWK